MFNSLSSRGGCIITLWGQWLTHGSMHADRQILYNVRSQWFVLVFFHELFVDQQFEAAKVRMTDLYQAISPKFGSPSYWPDKEESYYSLFGQFIKVITTSSVVEKSLRIFFLIFFCFVEI